MVSKSLNPSNMNQSITNEEMMNIRMKYQLDNRDDSNSHRYKPVKKQYLYQKLEKEFVENNVLPELELRQKALDEKKEQIMNNTFSIKQLRQHQMRHHETIMTRKQQSEEKLK